MKTYYVIIESWYLKYWLQKHIFLWVKKLRPRGANSLFNCHLDELVKKNHKTVHSLNLYWVLILCQELSWVWGIGVLLLWNLFRLMLTDSDHRDFSIFSYHFLTKGLIYTTYKWAPLSEKNACVLLLLVFLKFFFTYIDWSWLFSWQLPHLSI